MAGVKTCGLCGNSYTSGGYYCVTCYEYLRKHPEGIYPQPNIGEILYAPNGDPVCHICRRAYRKLGNHIQFFHHISQEDYRETYGLHHSTQLSNEDYIKTMRDYNKQYYDLVVGENLIEGGRSTRLKRNNKGPIRKIGNNQIQKQYLKWGS